MRLPIRFLDCILGVLANGENWRFGWLQFFVSDLEKNIAWTQTCGVRWAAFMNVPETSSALPHRICTHEGGGDGVAAGDLPALEWRKPVWLVFNSARRSCICFSNSSSLGLCRIWSLLVFDNSSQFAPFMPGSKCFRVTSSQTRE